MVSWYNLPDCGEIEYRAQPCFQARCAVHVSPTVWDGQKPCVAPCCGSGDLRVHRFMYLKLVCAQDEHNPHEISDVH